MPRTGREMMSLTSPFVFYLIGLVIVSTWYVLAIYDAKTVLRKRHAIASYSFYEYNPTIQPSSTNRKLSSKHHHADNDPKFIELQHRKQNLESMCKSFLDAGNGDRLYHEESTRIFFYSKSAKFGVCKAPKTGSSFMSKIFFALEPKMSTVKAFSMDRYEVHNGVYEQGEKALYRAQKYHQAVTTMVSRNPFERLYSAYIDKVFLIGTLNKGFGVSLESGLYATQEEACGYDVTFQGFLDQVVTMATRDEFDVHWLPVTYLCVPCHIKYDFICKTETLNDDINYIMGRLNLTQEKRNTLRKGIKTVWRNNNDVLSLIKTVKYDHDRFKAECPNILDLMEKIWTSLQLRGYIHKASPFPRRRFWTMKNGHMQIGTITNEDLLTIVHEEFLNRPMASKQMVKQRLQYLVSAYRNIDPKTISNIQKMYEYDFSLFNYDLDPPGWQSKT